MAEKTDGGMPKGRSLAQNPDRTWLAQRLSAATGITSAQASDLIFLVGANWSRLVREARALKEKDWRGDARVPAGN